MIISAPFDLTAATEREWLLTNGLGGYASSTLCGMHTRRYHGLLIAALNPPGSRTLLVAKLEEALRVGEQEYLLSTNQYPGVYYPHGYQYVTEVDVGDKAVITRFEAGGATLEKHVSMVQGQNTTRICYRNTGEIPFALQITPLVNGRDFHGDVHSGDIAFTVEHGRWQYGPEVHVRPSWMYAGYWLYANGGRWREEQTWYHNMVYIWERRRGLTDQDSHFSPGHFDTAIAPGEEWHITLSTDPPAVSADRDQSEWTARQTPADTPEEIKTLYHTAHSFLVQRTQMHGGERLPCGRTIIAGYHWFGDWGRDTMIALPGLCLLTGRPTDAAEILRTFAAARRKGLLPNLFMESGTGEAFNTVDASLWFVYAVDSYYRATGDRAIIEELRPALEEIIHYYRVGADFGIGMDSDGLIVANAPGWQLTWMDAKVGDWVVTPRMGKPVEINALWYNALRVMETFSRDFGWAGDYGEIAERVRANFTAFWFPTGGYLYDVLNDEPDTRLRPNQIFAVSLPYSPLDLNIARSVVATVERFLLTPYGLRTLAPQEPEYHGQYIGDVWRRDGAYHQGTVWAWLIGPYVDAYLRVNGGTPAAKTICRKLLQPLLDHVWHAGVGSISEIFDGNPPHLPRGTISQAWSVAEVLRAWERCQ